jgi:signal transduction histidine kinase
MKKYPLAGKNLFLFLVLLMACCRLAVAQKSKVDSLQKTYQKNKQYTTLLQLLLEKAGKVYLTTNIDSGILCMRQSLAFEELEKELKAGNNDEALAIASDIKQNEQKINHHGKRADGIVNGMLQHSRTGGGEKQQININTLADEFLRLSYHGLRAKDKTFNSEMVTHFDPDLPKINVVRQDIGRAMLNLFINAFYAVHQKLKTGGIEYKPQVTVSTTTENKQVVIKVKDNGNGIPMQLKIRSCSHFLLPSPLEKEQIWACR